MEQQSESAAALFARVLHGEQQRDGDAGAASTVDPSSGAIGGFLVCLDVPPMTEFGVDYEVFRTGDKFQGVKFVPLGVHLVVFRSKDQEHGIRQGFFVHVDRHAQVIVREWSAEKEELGLPRSGLNLETLEHAVLSFQLDDRLGAYPKQHWKTWQRLSSAISESVLRRCGIDFGALIVPGDSDALSSDSPPDGEVIPYFPDFPRTARFTSLQRKRSDLTGAARTTYHFDRSAMLEELIASSFGGSWRELLGEFQLAFVLFLQLSSLAALEQWKQFISLLCSCDSALESQLPLFVAFLKVFRVQMEQIAGNFFDDELTSDNFLRPCLSSLLELIGDPNVPDQIQRQGERLRDVLHRRFHWDFSSEEDELAPVVVPLEELLLADSSSRVEVDEDRRNAMIAAAFLQRDGS